MTGSDGGERLAWQALVALLLAMFAIAVGYGMFLPILPLLIERLGGKMGAASLSRHIGLLTGAYTLALFLFAPIWGRISDRLDRRPLILLGLLGFALSLASFALIDSRDCSRRALREHRTTRTTRANGAERFGASLVLALALP